MKVKKLNKELLDLYYKKDKKVYAYKAEDKVYLSDSYRAWIINNEDCVLDINKMNNVDLTKFFNEDGYETGIKTNEMVQLEKYVGVYITNEDKSLKVVISQKYLDVFENYTLKIKAEDKPVLVYEHEELVGLILPMRTF